MRLELDQAGAQSYSHPQCQAPPIPLYCYMKVTTTRRACGFQNMVWTSPLVHMATGMPELHILCRRFTIVTMVVVVTSDLSAS